METFKDLLKGVGGSYWVWLRCLPLLIVEAVIGLALPIFMGRMIDHPDQFNFVTVGILLSLFLIQVASGAMLVFWLGKASEFLILRLKDKVFGHMIRLPLRFFGQKKVGEMVSRIMSDCDQLSKLLSQDGVGLVSGVLTLLGTSVVLIVLDWRMALCLLFSLFLSGASMLIASQKLQEIGHGIQEETARVAGSMTSAFQGISTIKSFGQEVREQKQLKDQLDHLTVWRLKEVRKLAWLSPVVSFAFMLGMCLLLGYGGYRVSSGSLPLGTLVTFILFLFQLVFPVLQIALFTAEWARAMGASQSLHDILLQEKEKTDSGQKCPSVLRLHFDRVSFRYFEDQDWILKDVDFKLQPGLNLVVGPSGSGKSSLIKLILGFYNADQGTIRINGQRIDELSLKTLRNEIAVLEQDFALFAGSIKDNLLYGSGNEVHLLETIDQCALSHELAAWPDGVQYRIDERGTNLSAGQRQRLAFGRAIHKKTSVLLLDEPVSNLDSDSSDRIMRYCKELGGQKIVLCVTHNLRHVSMADQIVFMEEGKIAGQGTHEQLMTSVPAYRNWLKPVNLSSEAAKDTTTTPDGIGISL